MARTEYIEIRHVGSLGAALDEAQAAFDAASEELEAASDALQMALWADAPTDTIMAAQKRARKAFAAAERADELVTAARNRYFPH
jgi:hypothetical protein